MILQNNNLTFHVMGITTELLQVGVQNLVNKWIRNVTANVGSEILRSHLASLR
jgi:hypothetical protein